MRNNEYQYFYSSSFDNSILVLHFKMWWVQFSFLSSHILLSLPLLLVWHVCLMLVFMPVWQHLKCSCQWHCVLLSRWAFVWWVNARRAFVNGLYVQSVFVYTRNIHVGIPTLSCVHACSLTAEADLCERIQNVNWRERQGECMGECVCLMWCLFHVRSVKNCMSLDWIDDRLCHVAVVCI